MKYCFFKLKKIYLRTSTNLKTGHTLNHSTFDAVCRQSDSKSYQLKWPHKTDNNNSTLSYSFFADSLSAPARRAPIFIAAAKRHAVLLVTISR